MTDRGPEIAPSAMRLTVHYLIRGNLETDQRVGAHFRWQLTDGTAHVFEYDDRYQPTWTKTYRDAVTIEVTHGPEVPA